MTVPPVVADLYSNTSIQSENSFFALEPAWCSVRSFAPNSGMFVINGLTQGCLLSFFIYMGYLGHLSLS